MKNLDESLVYNTAYLSEQQLDELREQLNKLTPGHESYWRGKLEAGSIIRYSVNIEQWVISYYDKLTTIPVEALTLFE